MSYQRAKSMTLKAHALKLIYTNQIINYLIYKTKFQLSKNTLIKNEKKNVYF